MGGFSTINADDIPSVLRQTPSSEETMTIGNSDDTWLDNYMNAGEQPFPDLLQLPDFMNENQVIKEVKPDETDDANLLTWLNECIGVNQSKQIETNGEYDYDICVLDSLPSSTPVDDGAPRTAVAQESPVPSPQSQLVEQVDSIKLGDDTKASSEEKITIPVTNVEKTKSSLDIKDTIKEKTDTTPKMKCARSRATYDSIDAVQDNNKKRSRCPDGNKAEMDDIGQVEVFYFTNSISTTLFKGTCFLLRQGDRSEEGQLIQLPFADLYTSWTLDKKAKKNAETILSEENMKGGLKLEYEEGNIFATRYCRNYVFFSNFFKPNQAEKLERNQRTLIFDVEEFDRGLQMFNKGQGKPPNNIVYLGFAKQCIYADVIGNKIDVPIAAVAKCRKVQDIVDENRNTDLAAALDSLQISESIKEEVP